MKRREAGYRPGERLEVTIERIVPGGAGLARGPQGVVLVDYAAPGDTLQIEIESLRGGAARGRILAIVEPSPGRVEPPCPWYLSCGGCDLQHMSYEAQIAAKSAIVLDALERIGGIQLDREIECFHAPNPFASRSRIELQSDSASGAVGFFRRRSNQVIDIEQCMVCRPEIQAAISTIRSTSQPLPNAMHLLAGPGFVHCAPAIASIEGGPIWITVGGFDYLVHPAGFFQSSLDLLPALIDHVVDSAGGERQLAWDLFSGVGLFSLPLAAHFVSVVGVEVDERATANAIRSAERNRVANARFLAADVSSWLGRRRQRGVSPDLIVVDPPRTGLGIPLATVLRDRQPSRLTYVSCDPTTLARDLKVFCSGNLLIERVSIFDLFPQTHHVETVVRLVDKSLT